MPLASNTRVEAGAWEKTHSDAVTSGIYPRRFTEFVVSPNPCVNPSDRKIPGVYSFSKTVTSMPTGQIGGYYYGGSPSNRERIERSLVGTFPSELWNGFNNGGSTGFGTPLGYELEKLAARNRAVNKLLDKIRDSEINLSTTIGEGRETLQMVAAIARSVRSPLKALRSAVHRSRKGSRAEKITRDTLVTVGGLQLAWSVGLAPLLSDCENLRNHAQAAESMDLMYVAKSRGTSHLEWSSHPSEWETFENEISNWYQFGVTYRIGDMHAFENWRAGLTLRPTLAWELTTLSFVVDYFLQIGNFLAALEASYLNNGITFLHGYETQSEWKMSRYSHFRADDPRDRGALTGTVDHHLGVVKSKGYRQWVTKSRSRLSGLPVQALPTIKLPTASTQLLNCAALLSMLLRK